MGSGAQCDGKRHGVKYRVVSYSRLLATSRFRLFGTRASCKRIQISALQQAEMQLRSMLSPAKGVFKKSGAPAKTSLIRRQLRGRDQQQLCPPEEDAVEQATAPQPEVSVQRSVSDNVQGSTVADTVLESAQCAPQTQLTAQAGVSFDSRGHGTRASTLTSLQDKSESDQTSLQTAQCVHTQRTAPVGAAASQSGESEIEVVGEEATSAVNIASTAPLQMKTPSGGRTVPPFSDLHIKHSRGSRQHAMSPSFKQTGPPP